MNTIESVYDFWFGDCANDLAAGNRNALWFMGGDAVDQAIREQFEPLVLQACARQLDHWKQTARGSVALIVLLDQFPLNIYRGDARAYTSEQHSVEVCLEGIAHGQDRSLSFYERLFFYLPLEHSESSEHQRLSLQHFTALRDQAPPQCRDEAEAALTFAIDHKAIIDRFGRYPHRNKALGRVPTEEECTWLAGGGATFGQ